MDTPHAHIRAHSAPRRLAPPHLVITGNPAPAPVATDEDGLPASMTELEQTLSDLRVKEGQGQAAQDKEDEDEGDMPPGPPM